MWLTRSHRTGRELLCYLLSPVVLFLLLLTGHRPGGVRGAHTLGGSFLLCRELSTLPKRRWPGPATEEPTPPPTLPGMETCHFSGEFQHCPDFYGSPHFLSDPVQGQSMIWGLTQHPWLMRSGCSLLQERRQRWKRPMRPICLSPGDQCRILICRQTPQLFHG